ncbi:Catalytic domain of Male germ cell-Associated Kinase-like Serine/Threonine Kinase [Aspergillus parasiticus SU-1]|uniref:Kinase-like domain-containing protein n=2 Tax=Aspergillus parasiticus TaxID=5067 RepID=A0A5N6DUN7_ASPPA|nr:kinase-like domain-containing protein [Aspergillus parasiticus]KJK60621.1 Catalytic domain of Male germ cell-Associated Kinase-like Serine/Threonine Kinase [Aspergillus parasiticus SU-1]
MTVSYDHSSLRNAAPTSMATLEDRFEVMKEVGDGSFGSVAVARVRTAGSNIARRGTMVAIKTMKKTFDSLAPCLELREVIFLRTLPAHPHLVPALDIFLDPLSRKLHICMEYMDGNLYQLMKSRDHKPFDGKHVKSILYQILSGLDHIHAHHFFHRDIKPENILVSTSAPSDSAFSRYSNLVTPPSTPPTYTVKIADFGLARETHSKLPYTTYVSTRWYRAPEVLLRAGEYSAPVDMWAIGAMAVEIATLKPLFPGGNEVDQVWRVCEIMGSPGNWYSKSGSKLGGGEWRDGSRLAQKLGFTFPKMAPHSMESILQAPQWPTSLSHFVTWCLMWDPKNRPTSTQALNHEYFSDAVDPLRPKSSTARLLGRKTSDKSFKSPTRENSDSPSLTSKSSWFRRSLIGRSDSDNEQSKQPVVSYSTAPETTKIKPAPSKRATWANGAPMPILPSIRPVSPLSNAVTAQANSCIVGDNGKASKKIGRQLSLNSHGNHYADVHRQEAERALNGGNPLIGANQKESFFSHLRKRARRLSGRNQGNVGSDNVEANAGCMPWSNRSSLALDTASANDAKQGSDLSELDKALQGVKCSLDSTALGNVPVHITSPVEGVKRQSMPQGSIRSMGDSPVSTSGTGAPISSRTRRALQLSSHPVHRYETPEEEDELLDEALHSASKAARRLAQTETSSDGSSNFSHQAMGNDNSRALPSPYPTPSPSAKCNGVSFGHSDSTPIRRLGLPDGKADPATSNRQWPTPPYEDGDWNHSGTTNFMTGSTYR